MATGATITSKTGHTAVLNKKGEIIIYGGVYSTINTSEVNPLNLIFHTTNLVENYMIVAFGNRNITKTAIYEELPGQSDQLYILDINTFTWVRTFNPPDNNPEPAAANTIKQLYKYNNDNFNMSQQVTASQIDADSIFTSKSNVGVPRDMHQFNGDIKQHQYIASNLLLQITMLEI
ncbi:hypothetical protein C1645_837580 [Glomus cerebriforme]|uniref:Uncharacterized protein n=1 Tax=Glomus cerebriforme TaxID=658196 RepID=A0A397S6E4_9GLOM|nr:hypothetical protein C1645_837580 [Glomus cerebriforme]